VVIGGLNILTMTERFMKSLFTFVTHFVRWWYFFQKPVLTPCPQHWSN